MAKKRSSKMKKKQGPQSAAEIDQEANTNLKAKIDPTQSTVNDLPRHAKTMKGRKILNEREGELVEGPKKSIVLKGNKSSITMNKVLSEWHMLRGDSVSTNFSKKKNTAYPFEDSSIIEHATNKFGASMFVFGSHSKKRPNNLVLGRLYDKKMLDMIELGVTNFKSIFSFGCATIDIESVPLLIFQGDQWEYETKMIRLKSMLMD